MTSDIQRIFDFMIELDKLKFVLRKTKLLGSDRYENSAEHSWQVCMLAQLLAQESTVPINGGFYKSPDPVTLLSCKTACLTLRTVTPV